MMKKVASIIVMCAFVIMIFTACAKTCETCDGSGKTSCSECGGLGQIECVFCKGEKNQKQICELCKGTGLVNTPYPCKECCPEGGNKMVLSEYHPGIDLDAWVEATSSQEVITIVEDSRRAGYLKDVFTEYSKKYPCKACDGTACERKQCPDCKGSGHGNSICSTCSGEGYTVCEKCNGKGEIKCLDCGGDGKQED